MSRLAISIVASVVVVGMLTSRVALAEEAKCEGTITKIEGEKITVKATTGEQQMTVVPATKVMIDGKTAKVTDLKVGQNAKCTCNKDGNRMTCNMIEASSRVE